MDFLECSAKAWTNAGKLWFHVICALSWQQSKHYVEPAIVCQRHPQMSPGSLLKSRPGAPKTFRNESRGAHESQDVPKSHSRAPKSSPRAPKKRPKWPKRRHMSGLVVALGTQDLQIWKLKCHKIDDKKQVVFRLEFFMVWASFLRCFLLGSWSQSASKLQKHDFYENLQNIDFI